MNRKEIYALGHALVDVELSVSEALLNELQLTKGSMTLIDEAELQRLIQRLHLGEATRSCGGSAANTVIAVAQFGGSAFLTCQVANDEAGRFFAADLRANGVEYDGLPLEGGMTGHCLVLITPDGERTMCTHLGVSTHFSPAHLDEERIRQAAYLYLEGYMVSSPTGLATGIEAARLAKRSGVKTALTFSDVNMIRYFRQEMDQLLGEGVDLLFCNEQEALTYTESATLEEAKSQLREKATLVAITKGRCGAVLLTPDQEHEIIGTPVVAVDTTGAGDLFAGAFLHGVTHDIAIDQAGHFACRAATRIVGQYGARLTKEEALAIQQPMR